MVKTGFGLDVHAFAADRPCVLAGITIPCDMGLAGHSDADVATHALIDALLGAAALGDIGQWFPDSDPAYRGVRSTELLIRVTEAVRQQGFEVVHADLTVAAEKPRLAPHIGAMRALLAEVMDVALDAVSVKATTTEKLGFTGREEGIAAAAVVTLERVQTGPRTLDVRQLSPQNLAYIGDAVYELHIRRYLLEKGITRGHALQRAALGYVSAKAQAAMIMAIKDDLSAEEERVLKWGRNATSGSVPRSTTVSEYRYSTGVEALIGWLYLNGRRERLDHLLARMIETKEE